MKPKTFTIWPFMGKVYSPILGTQLRSRHTSLPSCAGKLAHKSEKVWSDEYQVGLKAPPPEGPGYHLATPGTSEAGTRHLAQAHLLVEAGLLVVVLKVNEDAQ